jgi:sugar phosphate permease
MTSTPAKMGYGRTVLVVLLPFAGGYFISYLFRMVNAVIAPDLVRDVNLTAADLGLLTAAYFISFALVQVVLGPLLDRFGPRRVQATLLLFMALGSVGFGLGRDQTELVTARALIGLGAAASLMGSLKAISQWFPPERWALVNSLFIGFGGLGALVATTPLEAALQLTDWRGIFLALAVAVLLVAAAIFFVVPEGPGHGAGEGIARQFRSLGTIFGSAAFWRVAPLTTALYASAMALQGLWLGPWARDMLGAGRDAVAADLQLIAIGFTLGCVLTGVISDLLVRAGLSLHRIMGLFSVLYILTLTPFIWPYAGGHPTIWLAFGLMTNVGVLAYVIVPQSFPLSFTGRANSALNLVVFAFAFGMQYAVGGIIDLWPRDAAGGYAPEGYRAAFGATAVVVTLSLLWYWVPLKKRSS